MRGPAQRPTRFAVPDELAAMLQFAGELFREELGLVPVQKPVGTDAALPEEHLPVCLHNPGCANVLTMLHNHDETVHVLR